MNDFRRRTSDQPVTARLLASAHTIWGGVLTLVLIGLIAFLVASRGEYFHPPEWVALYVGIALVSGMVFWIVTPGGSGEIEFKQLGAKLGGGAAVGAVFMLLAKQITPPAEAGVALIALPSEAARIVPVTRGLSVQLLSPAEALVQFDERLRDGVFRIESYDQQTLEPELTCFIVRRDAAEPETTDCE